MPKTTKKPLNGAGPSTLTSEIFEQLRKDIKVGTFAPGQKLNIKALQTYYQAGGSPMREALNRLSALGLVEQSDQRGFRVAPITVSGVRELARTRCWISEIALREAILNGDSAWEEELVLAYHRLSRYPIKLPVNRPDATLETLHRQFHSALIAACPSPWLRDIHERLFDHADRVVFLAHSKKVERDINAEHQAIMEAVLNRDTKKAVKLMNRHIMDTAVRAEKAWAEILKSRPAE